MPHPFIFRTRDAAPSPRLRKLLEELSAAAIERLWSDFALRRCTSARTKLIIHYMEGHVRRIAVRLHKMLPNQVDLEDLVQQGYLGLVEAMDRFDPNRDVTFETFSSLRIAGAMQDYLRRVDHLPRMMRKRLKLVQAAEDDFRKRHGRAPSEDDLRRTVQTSQPEFRRYLNERLTAGPMSMHARSSAEGAPCDAESLLTMIDERQRSPLSTIERENLREWICRGLDRRDRLILQLYYYEELTMREVGIALGISESRVSQRLDLIHDRIRARLSLDEAERELVML